MTLIHKILPLFLLTIMQMHHAQPINSVIQKFQEEHNHFQEPKSVRGNYTLDMTVEAIISYLLSGDTVFYSECVRRFEPGDKYGPPAMVFLKQNI